MINTVSEKQKLTLSVEKELVEKAKKLGVNISEITETVLRHVSETEIKEVVTKSEINAAYQKLFDAMLPAMKKFGASVDVGSIPFYDKDGNYSSSSDVTLGVDGNLWIDDVEDTTKIEYVSLGSPKIILSNFIESLVKASERNKIKLKELEIFRKIVEALTETTVTHLRQIQTKTPIGKAPYVYKSIQSPLTPIDFNKSIAASQIAHPLSIPLGNA